MLKLDGIYAGYGRGIEILRGASLHVNESEVVCIVGPNGAGKSTLLRAISGLLRPSRGNILFDHQNIVGRSAHSIVAMGIAHVPQGRSAIPYMSVQENLELGGYLTNDRKLVQQRIESVFEMFPVLRDRRSLKAGRMSGGEQQMLEMGRALVMEPKLLLLDEPTLGLAPMISRMIFERIRNLAQSGLTILMVEQNARLGLSASDRGYVMEQGRVRIEGPAATLLDSEEIGQLFLGGSTKIATVSHPSFASGDNLNSGDDR